MIIDYLGDPVNQARSVDVIEVYGFLSPFSDWSRWAADVMNEVGTFLLFYYHLYCITRLILTLYCLLLTYELYP